MAKKSIYMLRLTVEGTIPDDAKDEIADAMAGEVSQVLCDLRGGDSGGVGVRFVGQT